jgi:hypothetical protein
MAMRISPFLNKEEMFKDFTLDYDNITNDILALDRGQWRPPGRFDDHKYICKKLSTRMKQADYDFLIRNQANVRQKVVDARRISSSSRPKSLPPRKRVSFQVLGTSLRWIITLRNPVETPIRRNAFAFLRKVWLGFWINSKSKALSSPILPNSPEASNPT